MTVVKYQRIIVLYINTSSNKLSTKIFVVSGNASHLICTCTFFALKPFPTRFHFLICSFNLQGWNIHYIYYTLSWDIYIQICRSWTVVSWPKQGNCVVAPACGPLKPVAHVAGPGRCTYSKIRYPDLYRLFFRPRDRQDGTFTFYSFQCLISMLIFFAKYALWRKWHVTGFMIMIQWHIYYTYSALEFNISADDAGILTLSLPMQPSKP